MSIIGGILLISLILGIAWLLLRTAFKTIGIIIIISFAIVILYTIFNRD